MRVGSGRCYTGLPRPRPTDDAWLVARAQLLWRVQKRRLAQMSRTQTLRLEQVMIDCLRWSPSEFRRDIRDYPLMRELGRRLIWGGYNAEARSWKGSAWMAT